MLELLIFLLKSTETYLPSPVNNNNKISSFDETLHREGQ